MNLLVAMIADDKFAYSWYIFLGKPICLLYLYE